MFLYYCTNGHQVICSSHSAMQAPSGPGHLRLIIRAPGAPGHLWCAPGAPGRRSWSACPSAGHPRHHTGAFGARAARHVGTASSVVREEGRRACSIAPPLPMRRGGRNVRQGGRGRDEIRRGGTHTSTRMCPSHEGAFTACLSICSLAGQVLTWAQSSNYIQAFDKIQVTSGAKWAGVFVTPKSIHIVHKLRGSTPMLLQ